MYLVGPFKLGDSQARLREAARERLRQKFGNGSLSSAGGPGHPSPEDHIYSPKYIVCIVHVLYVHIDSMHSVLYMHILYIHVYISYICRHLTYYIHSISSA